MASEKKKKKNGGRFQRNAKRRKSPWIILELWKPTTYDRVNAVLSH